MQTNIILCFYIWLPCLVSEWYGPATSHPDINSVTNICFHLFGPHAVSQVGDMEQTEVIKPQTLDDLIKILHKIFESDHINIEEVQNIMESYESNPQEWSKFAKFDQYRQVIMGSRHISVNIDN